MLLRDADRAAPPAVQCRDVRGEAGPHVRGGPGSQHDVARGGAAPGGLRALRAGGRIAVDGPGRRRACWAGDADVILVRARRASSGTSCATGAALGAAPPQRRGRGGGRRRRSRTPTGSWRPIPRELGAEVSPTLASIGARAERPPRRGAPAIEVRHARLVQRGAELPRLHGARHSGAARHDHRHAAHRDEHRPREGIRHARPAQRDAGDARARSSPPS